MAESFIERFGKWIQRRIPMIGEYGSVSRRDRDDPWPREITPAIVRSALSNATNGDPDDQARLFDSLLESDGYLRGVYGTRKDAILGLPWEITPSDDRNVLREDPDPKAEEAADYCAGILAKIETFDEALAHIADAIGYSVAAVETVYKADGSRIVPSYFRPLAHDELTSSPSDVSELRVLTDQEPTTGIPIGDLPNKYIVHKPYRIGASPFRGGILRSVAVWAMMHRYGFQWYSNDLETVGSPTIIGYYNKNAEPEEKSAFKRMLREFGTDRMGLFSDGLRIETIERRSAPPHGAFLVKIEELFAIAILGQTLTTRMGAEGGAYAAAEIHDQVRKDILRADLRAEARTIRADLLRPMILLRFGPDYPVPFWRRIVEKPKDTEQTGRIIEQGRRLGIRPAKQWVADELGIPLGPEDNPEDPIPEGGASPLATLPFSAASRYQFADIPKPKPISPAALLSAWSSEAAEKVHDHAKAIFGSKAVNGAGARTLAAVKANLRKSLDRLPSENLEGALYRYLLACEMYGLFNARVQIARKRSGQIRAAFAEPSLDPFAKPFEEAVKALQDRLKLSPNAFLSLDKAARSRAGRIAGQFNMRIVQDVYSAVEEAIEAGDTLRDFREAVRELPEGRGWIGDRSWHVNLVFRQNASMSYAAGHLQGFKEAAIGKWQFKVWNDSCPICEPMSDLVFSTEDTAYYPPLHFNCDCYADPVFDGEPEGEEVRSSETISNPAYDESQETASAFRWDPAQFAKLEAFDLSAVPEDLRPAFRAFAESKGWEVTG